LRSGGIIRSRIGEALAHGRYGLTRPYAFVGLHLREQKAIAGKRHLIYAHGPGPGPGQRGEPGGLSTS